MTCYIRLLPIFLTIGVPVDSQTTEHISLISNHEATTTKALVDNSVRETDTTAGHNDPTDDLWLTKGVFAHNLHVTSSFRGVTESATTSSAGSGRRLTIEDSTDQSHPCLRPCVVNDPPKTCFYRFEVELYFAMSKACYNCPENSTDCNRPDCIAGDGFKRLLLAVNRQMPGPSIEVCHRDHIVVDVFNNMTELSVSLHWHGIIQEGTPYMDGVPFITQCPIPPSSSFRYEFEANTAGTHFWHSHLGVQRGNGLFGSLIVRMPRSLDPNTAAYDKDVPSHTMQILDWDHVSSDDKFASHYHAGGDNKPPTLLINGRGRNYEVTEPDHRHVPLATFNVTQGFRYRFRLINAGFLNCPIQLSIDNHNITIIASDGGALQPVEAESLVSYAGERFDFVVNASQPVANYWVRLRGLMDCTSKFAHQVAVLHYEGADNEDPRANVSYQAANRTGLQVNPLNTGMNSTTGKIIPELNAAVDDDDRLKPEADMTLYVAYDFYPLDNPLFQKPHLYGFNQVSQKVYTPQLNHISMKLPPAPPLSQLDDLDPSIFCNGSSVSKNCTNQYCECLHLLRVPLGAVVELFIIDEGVVYDANHPFHIHGTNFRVIAMDRLNTSTSLEQVMQLDRDGGVHRKLHGAPIKDTVTVPDGGYTLVRFKATNPGIWMLHCHIDFHSDIGMALVFQFGDRTDFPPVPQGFPRCGNHSSFRG